MPGTFSVFTIPGGEFAGFFVLKTSHADWSNFLFTDGHIEFRRIYKVNSTNEMARCQWNYDFEPH
jgi:prepilin-type processing-associated H-X9-DG protein